MILYQIKRTFLEHFNKYLIINFYIKIRNKMPLLLFMIKEL